MGGSEGLLMQRMGPEGDQEDSGEERLSRLGGRASCTENFSQGKT